MKLFFFIMISLCAVELTYAYPEIVDWQNSPTVVFDNKKKAVLNRKGLLKRPFAVLTESKAEITLRINPFDKITIFEKSKVQILDFANEGENVGDFYLIDGKLRYVSEFKGLGGSDSELILKTPFFDLKLNAQVDFFIELNLVEASVQLRVVKGVLPVEFFSYEKKLSLNEGQQVKFQGELSDDKQSIKYDYLLNGKKIPRGQLLEVVTFDRESYLKVDEEQRLAEIKRKKEIETKRLDKIRKQKDYEDSFLCKKPFAQKDQCAWWIEKKKCYRKRCNVSGQWGARTERPLSNLCKSEFTVQACDY